MTSLQIQYLIIGLLIFDFIFNKFIFYLNNKNWKPIVPEEMKDVLDEDKYAKAAAYHKENGKLSLLSSSLSFIIILAFAGLGWFGDLDDYFKTLSDSEFIQTATFFFVLFIASDLLSLPFTIYQTFVIEEKYGFNKMTPKTFVLDKIKGYLLAAAIGGGLLWLVMWVYVNIDTGFWLWLWAIIGAFVLLLNMFYADIILPIFNKLSPLEEGDLKTEIKQYADKIGYAIKHIYVIDGSKRSTKANAFFSGLGPRKTIALYDTLIEKNTNEELTAILAHEVGHFKKKHILASMILSILQLGITLFLLEFFIGQIEVSEALGGTSISFALGVIAFGFIFSPVGLILGILMNVLSRKNEFEADAYAKNTYDSEALINGLKKLSVDSMSNLYPHPWYVFIHYSHPPVLERIKALRE